MQSTDRMGAFREGWWIMATIIALGLIPTFVLIRPRRKEIAA